MVKTLINKGTLRPGVGHSVPRPQEKVAELGLEPVFGPCSAESAALSPSQSQTLSWVPCSMVPRDRDHGQISQRREHLESWERNQHWDSQDFGEVPGDLRHDSEKPPGLWHQNSSAVYLGKGHHILQDFKFAKSGAAALTQGLPKTLPPGSAHGFPCSWACLERGQVSGSSAEYLSQQQT